VPVVVNSTRVGTISPMERQRTLLFEDPGGAAGKAGSTTT
jgi:hypothetical protein